MEITRVRIGVVIGQGSGYEREVLRGVGDFGRHQENWGLQNLGGEMDRIPKLGTWGAHGVIAMVTGQEVTDRLAALGVSVVNVSSVGTRYALPSVVSDNTAVGRAAADHLLDRGHRVLGFVGEAGHPVSEGRKAGFAEAVQERGIEVSVFEYDWPTDRPADEPLWMGQQRAIQAWAQDLGSPAGIFAYNDLEARRVADAVQETGIRVPEDLAIVGADNDRLVCEVASPPLSSVQVPSHSIGYEACGLLDRLIRGEAPPAEPLLLPPAGVVTRQSTELLAVEDPEVAAAVAFIRDHAAEAIDVSDVVEATATNRRYLERHFRDALGRTLLQEIRRVHLDRAKTLLTETDLTVYEVARRSGFSSDIRLCTLFKRETGYTPTEYRKRYRVS